MKDLFIFGAGGLGRETAWVIERINKERLTWNLCGFVDDNPELKGKVLNGIPVLGSFDTFIQTVRKSYFIIAIANPAIRRSIRSRLMHYKNHQSATIIDPSVILSNSVEIGEGSIILPGCVITVDVKLGNYVIINYATTIGHDSSIGDFCTVYPGVHIAGNVGIKENSQIGTGAVILQGLTIESNSFIGGQAAVIESVNDSGIFVGIPAHKIPKKKDN